MLDKFDCPESIRNILLNSSKEVQISEAEGDNVSRLTVPLQNAHKNVAQAAPLLSSLSPSQRKAVSEQLIDIASQAMLALEKSLRRPGTADSQLLSDVRKISKSLMNLDKNYEQLQISEGSLPKEFDSGEIDDTISPEAYHVLSDNVDYEEEEDLLPEEGEATPEELNADDEATQDRIINTIADGNPEDVTEGKAIGKLPKEFKGSKRTAADSEASNLRVLRSAVAQI